MSEVAYPPHIARVRKHVLQLVRSNPVAQPYAEFFEQLDPRVWLHLPDPPAVQLDQDFSFHVLDTDYEVRSSGTVVRVSGVTDAGHDVCVYVHGFDPRFVISYGMGVEKSRQEIALDLQRLEIGLRQYIERECVKNGRIAGLDEKTYSDLEDTGLIRRFQQEKGFPVIGYRRDDEFELFVTLEVAWPGLVPIFRQYLWDHHKELGVFEANVDYTTRFFEDNALVAQSWWTLLGGTYQIIGEEKRQTLCHYELNLSTFKNIRQEKWDKMPPYSLYSMDIECKGSRGFPVPENDNDVVINIGYTGAVGKKIVKRGVLVRNTARPFDPEAVLTCVPDENALLLVYLYWMLMVRPSIETGWNIKNFDFDWMIRRAIHKKLLIANKWSQFKSHLCRVRETVFQTRAAGKHNIKDVSVPGMAVFDLFQVIKREVPLIKKYKLTSFKLESVATAILGDHKDEMDYKMIPILDETEEGRTRLAKYVLKDALLPVNIALKLNLVTSYIMQCRLTSVNFQDYVTRGVQAKIIGSLLREAHDTKLNPLRYFLNTRDPRVMGVITGYEGATVIEAPAGGVFLKEDTPVATLDFASLYPSIEMAYNLCYTTVITLERIQQLGLDMQKDITYIPSKDGKIEGPFFVKKHIREGIVPRLLKRLVADRKDAKTKMAQAEMRAGVAKIMLEEQLTHAQLMARAEALPTVTKNDEEKRDFQLKGLKLLKQQIIDIGETFDANVMLTKEQLASYIQTNAFEASLMNMLQEGKKIICNSVYGFTGVKAGKLPCKEVAEMTTKIGRFLIHLTCQLVESRVKKIYGYPFDAEVIYGDTDSVFFKCMGIEIPDSVTDPQERFYYRGKIVMEKGKEIADMITKEINNPPVKIEFEKVFLALLFTYKEPNTQKDKFCRRVDGSKKRYVGLRWTDINSQPELKAMGLETVRRDGCPLQREVLTKVLKLVVEDRNTEGAVKYVQDIHHQLYSGKIPFEKLIISKSLGKNPEDYGEDDAEGEEIFLDELGAGDREAMNEQDASPMDIDEDSDSDSEAEAPQAKRQRTAFDQIQWKDGAKAKERKKTKARIGHVELAKKKGDMYHSGDRVKGVVTAGSKKAKMFEKFMDPVDAITNSIPLDYDYYWLNQIRAPLERIMYPVLAQKEMNVLGEMWTPLDGVTKELDHMTQTVSKTKKLTSTDGIMNKFLAANKAGSCIKCHVPLPRAGDSICTYCYDSAREIAVKKMVEHAEVKEDYGKLHTECVKCKGGDPSEDIWGCVNSDCKIFFTRVIAKLKLDKSEQELQKILEW